MTEPARAVALTALAELWEQGCPIASPNDRERLVDVGLRRWHSFHRRHPRIRQPSHEARIRDLVRGLVDAVEPEPRLVGPLLAGDFDSWDRNYLLRLITQHPQADRGVLLLVL